MGCLPILLLPLGCGVGYLIAGHTGALWGALIGLLSGLLVLGLFMRFVRRR